jgi:hypothetical protein
MTPPDAPSCVRGSRSDIRPLWVRPAKPSDESAEVQAMTHVSAVVVVAAVSWITLMMLVWLLCRAAARADSEAKRLLQVVPGGDAGRFRRRH